MSENLHQRALERIAKARVEGLADSERAWLDTHLQDCGFCREHARQTDRALRSLRTAAIPLPPDLASRTQFRVRLRAIELREREPKRRMLWLACAASWVFGIASAPFVWRVFEWLGQLTGAPKLVLEIGFGLWWTIPALFAVMVLLLEGARHPGEPDWTKPGR
jgi:predicted anti-sigma-YlaC factor YlaD